MQKEERDRGHKLFQKLNEIFQQDPNISELAFVPISACENANTEFLYDRSHKLGIVVSVVPILAKYAHYMLRLLETNDNKKEAASPGQTLLVLLVTRTILLLNGNQLHVWHVRKRYLRDQQFKVTDLEKELQLISVVLTQHTKADNAWAHRKFVLKQLLPQLSSIDRKEQQLQKELDLCRVVAKKRKRNYYAWTHRMNLIPLLSEKQREQQWEETKHWMRCFIYDYCCLHFRQQLVLAFCATMVENSDEALPMFSMLQQYTSSSSSSKQLTKQFYEKYFHPEFTFLSESIQQYPKNASMWKHRRFFVSLRFMLNQSTQQQTMFDEEQKWVEQIQLTNKQCEQAQHQCMDHLIALQCMFPKLQAQTPKQTLIKKRLS